MEPLTSPGLVTGVDRPPTASSDIPAADRESQAWIERLRATGPERDPAIRELHALLLRAARFEIGRRYARSGHLRGGDIDDLAHQSADDALVAILSRLGGFRGRSRFTTWAYKFALYEAAANVRRRAWQGREIPVDCGMWPGLGDDGARTLQQGAEMTELLGAVRQAIQQDLSPHQREVLVAVVLNDVPIDVLAERLNTTRGALYKTIHDARQKLRGALAARGLSVEEREGSP